MKIPFHLCPFVSVKHRSDPFQGGSGADGKPFKWRMGNLRVGPAPLAVLAGFFWTGGVMPSLRAGVVFSESFETPVVSGFDDNTIPTTGWVGASNGFGATNRGLYNEFVAWPGVPVFSTPFEQQAYYLNYSNSGLTTAQGATGQNLTEGVTYSVTFNAGVRSGQSGNYLVELVAFEASEDNSARSNAQASRPGTILATATGTVTNSTLSAVGSISYTPDGSNPHLGKDLGIRLIKSSGSVLYDNIRMITGHDLAPLPPSGVTLPSGPVQLSWVNPPATNGSDVAVDVWFGTNPGSLTRVVDGSLNLTDFTVNADTANAYYWRVDVFRDGNPSGVPESGYLFVFFVEDTDGDGLPDVYELAHTTPPSNVNMDPGGDPENDGAGDGLTNLQEYQYGTDPNDPDSDHDDLDDGPEIAGAGLRPPTNPLLFDTDGDGLSDSVESNSGSWNGPTDTGTNPVDSDFDNDGLIDGVETRTGVFASRFNTGTDPYLPDSDMDGVWDWYEVAGALTNPNDIGSKPDVPYPLPDPDGSGGTTNKPVKVYILSGQSNMVGIGYLNGNEPGSLESMAKRENKFPNLVDGSGNWTQRNDVIYKGVVTATAAGPLTAGQGGGNDRVGPELGFGHIMGWFHDEPVLILKASQGNRSLGWDFLPPGSPQYTWNNDGYTYAGYGDTPDRWLTGTTPVPVNWYAGKQYDECFEGAHDVLDNFATNYPQWAAQGYEIAGFVWWQGHKDQYTAAHYGRYETNLVAMVNALRTEFNAPNAPFVIGTIGFGGQPYAPGTPYRAIYDAQIAVGDVARHPEFAGSVKTIDTLPYWRALDESPGNQDFHYNNNAETYTLVGDALGRAMLTLQDDSTPPSPSPMSFDLPPGPVDDTTVGMWATQALDPSGPVEYYFENETTADFRDWGTDRSWYPTGLTPGQSMSFRVKARDGKGNETGWSPSFAATPGPDGSSPSPTTMSFSLFPTALGDSTVTMTATPALDLNGVEYFFDCLSAGGHDSGWQDSPEYTDTGLSPGTEYVYTVQARDKSAAQNPTLASAPASVTTPAPDLSAPVFTSLSPPAGASNVVTTTALEITFDEPVVVGSGEITLVNLTDTTQSAILVSDASQVSLSGSVLTLRPSTPLAAGKDYAVLLAAGVVEDLSGNPFAGITNQMTWNFSTLPPPPVGLLFSEDFESPTTPAAYSEGTAPDNGSWVKATEGFGGSQHGITDKAGGDFSAPDPNHQAYAFRYTNSGLTTQDGVIGVLAEGVTYTVSFDAVRDGGGNNGTPFTVQLIAFAESAPRNDCRSTPANSSVLASRSGNCPTNGLFGTYSFEFTPDPVTHAGSIGKDLGIRLKGASISAIIDNVRITSSGGNVPDFTFWITGYNVGGLDGFTDDPDLDGDPNGLEYLYGTHPNGLEEGLIAVTAGTGTFTFSHPMNPTAQNVAAVYRWSKDIEHFHDGGASDPEGTMVNFVPSAPVNGRVTVVAHISGTPTTHLVVLVGVEQTE